MWRMNIPALYVSNRDNGSNCSGWQKWIFWVKLKCLASHPFKRWLAPLLLFCGLSLSISLCELCYSGKGQMTSKRAMHLCRRSFFEAHLITHVWPLCFLRSLSADRHAFIRHRRISSSCEDLVSRHLAGQPPIGHHVRKELGCNNDQKWAPCLLWFQGLKTGSGVQPSHRSSPAVTHGAERMRDLVMLRPLLSSHRD